ncbi:hypothetical protein SAMN05216553_12131 [Lentzea fradiae]|uniref:Uncharacterized protein n=1 Tax=Lentzea fradiae TaxID=200378 RepID=A0A1G8C5Y5_9PSEU|nr:hypothetical protein SAMN05216553_12131 [Lentzea fradiae]
MHRIPSEAADAGQPEPHRAAADTTGVGPESLRYNLTPASGDLDELMLDDRDLYEQGSPLTG